MHQHKGSQVKTCLEPSVNWIKGIKIAASKKEGQVKRQLRTVKVCERAHTVGALFLPGNSFDNVKMEDIRFSVVAFARGRNVSCHGSL